jgi:hypothetical protein
MPNLIDYILSDPERPMRIAMRLTWFMCVTGLLWVAAAIIYMINN